MSWPPRFFIGMESKEKISTRDYATLFNDKYWDVSAFKKLCDYYKPTNDQITNTLAAYFTTRLLPTYKDICIA